MTTAQQVIDVAASQIGYVEGPNNDTRFGQWYGANYAPWCAEFQSWVFWTAFHAHGQPSPLEHIQTDKGAAYCPLIVNWARSRGIWRPDPQPGRLALFDWNHDGVSDHIGLVTSTQDGSGNYSTIEGNTGETSNADGGQVMRRSRSNVQGYTMGFADLSGFYSSAPAPAPSAPPSPTASAPAWPGRMISLTSPNMTGSDVLTWQNQMRRRGWTITADGIYGPGSQKVCKAFQSEKGLNPDGIVGPVTWLASWTAPR